MDNTKNGKVVDLNAELKPIISRAQRKELERIQLKLKGYINAFYSICYFEEDKLDWNVISQQEYNRLKLKWIEYCKKKNYGKEISTAFHLDCMLLKTDLIMQVKYNAEADKDELMKLLREGKTPLDVADYAKENLKLTEL